MRRDRGRKGISMTLTEQAAALDTAEIATELLAGHAPDTDILNW